MNKAVFNNFEEYENSKKVRCANCGREVKDLEKGCSECNYSKEYNTENYNVRLENMMKEQNTLSSILKTISYIGIVLIFIMSFFLGKNTYGDLDILLLLEVWITHGGIFLGIYALSEIIQILHDIRFKLWRK